jgi:hypothetical protein
VTSEQAKERLNYLLEDKCDCPQCQLDKEAYRVILKKLKEKTNEALVMRRQRDDIRKSYRDSIPKNKIRKSLKHCEEELEKINNGEEFEDERDFYNYAILIYKDLLKEE